MISKKSTILDRLQKEKIVNFQNVLKKSAAALTISLAAFAAGATAQRGTTLVLEKEKEPVPVAMGNNLYCAGYVQSSPVDDSNKIIGAQNEQDGFVFSAKNFMYINRGSGSGVKVGDMYSVIRPKGHVDSKWTKKGDLGIYVQEVGAVEVVDVKSDHSVVRVKSSCDNLLLGDLITPAVPRTSPLWEERPAFDMFANSSGKATGRIIFARDHHEMIGREQIVYIDLGNDENVRIGDRLTIFRPLGKGNLYLNDKWEHVSARSDGNQSDQYRGDKFSNQTGRKKGDNARGSVVTNNDAKRGRPDIRKVVGEMVVLNVKEKVATAVITRTVQEIQTGDWVEVQ